MLSGVRSSIDRSQSRQGDKMRSRRVVIPAIAAFIVLFIAFGFYLRVLWGQLDQAFSQNEDYIPTRVYSDVTRTRPPEPRGYLEGRLKALGYAPKTDET